MRKNKIAYHCYADDTQLYLEQSPNDYSPIDSDEVNSWMCQNFLKLKKKLKSLRWETKVTFSRWMHLDARDLTTKNQVRNFGVSLESDLSFSSHVKTKTKSAYYHLKNIARIRCFVSNQDLEKFVHAFITNRVDYCNGSCSSYRTLLPGFWAEPENMNISHQSSGLYIGSPLHLGLILKYYYWYINHSMG